MFAECRFEDYTVSTDPHRLDVDVIHGFLAQSYWASGIPRAEVEKSIQNSLCFGLYYHEQQVGFARVVTDYTLHAYLCDVFVLPEHRGRGLGRWLMECVVSYPLLQNIRRMLLMTADAHEFYVKLGFHALSQPEFMLERTYIRYWEQD